MSGNILNSALTPTTAPTAMSWDHSRSGARRKALASISRRGGSSSSATRPRHRLRKAIGANTIAVATGAFSVAELSSHHPTHVFPDLSDTPALLKIVLA